MTILGIDPGTATMGFGVVRKDNGKLIHVDHGAIRTSKDDHQAVRLVQLYDGVEELIRKYKPVAISVEKLFFSANSNTAMTVGEARGVVLLAAAKNSLPIYEYTPLQIKMAITGYGRAEKRQIQEMVKLILKLETFPKPDDAADGLAIAICHINSFNPNLPNIK